MRVIAALVLGTVALAASPAGAASSAGSKHVKASLVAEMESVRAGEPFWVGLRLEMADGWHTYWKNPGDSGLPTRIAWTLPEGFLAGPIVWPHPERIEAGPLVSHGYEDEVLLLTRVVPAANLAAPGPVTLAAKVNWLECKEACLPGKADLDLTLPVSTEPPRPAERWAGLFAKARSQVPAEPGAWAFTIHRREGGLSLAAKPPAGTDPPRGAHFFADDAEVLDYAAPQKLKLTADGFRLDVLPAANAKPAASLVGVLVTEGPRGSRAVHVEAALVDAAAPVAVAEAAGGGPGLLLALGLAFLGGVILNLMPCVLPVLSLKVLAFVRHSGGERGAWRHGVAFTAGALVFFWVLAGILLVLRAGGQRVGWGFQLQEPSFVVFLSGLFLLLALNLFGVFELGQSLVATGGLVAGRSGLIASFGSGALATLMATPCTAPFMGSALGFALGQPAAVTLVVFTFLGLGMAAPYLLLSIFPALLRFVPRPGPWMVAFKQLMGFFMLGTVAVLLWLFGRQVGVDGMALLLGALILMGLGGWVWGRGGAPERPRRSRLLAATTGALLVAAGLALGLAQAQALPPGRAAAAQPTSGLRWEPFSTERLRELRAGGTPVFIDFTADWCLTCQVNERVALHRSEVVERFQREGIVALKADWTRKDDAITQALFGYGRQGVPLYVLYGREPEQEPELLPEVLSPGIVLAAIDRKVSSLKEAKSE
jgi:thiol:disulfide interchange protein